MACWTVASRVTQRRPRATRSTPACVARRLVARPDASSVMVARTAMAWEGSAAGSDRDTGGEEDEGSRTALDMTGS